MLVLDPLVVAIQQLPPWAIALGGFVVAAALLVQRTSSKSGVTPRKIHSLGTSIPIFGDMIENLKQSDVRHDWITATSLRFRNEPWRLNVPGAPKMVVITDPSLIESVMVKHHKNFVKDATQRGVMHDLLGDGIVNADGEQWFHQRKTAAKFFSARTLRTCMTNTMQRNVQQVYKVLDPYNGTGDFANLSKVFQEFTLQTFLEVGVGVDDQIIGSTVPSKFDAVDEAMMLMSRRTMLPHVVWKLQRWLQVGPEKRLAGLLEKVHTYINDLVNQALAKRNTEGSGQADSDKIRSAIDLFVEHSGEDTAGLRPRDLVDFVLNFVLAARDTSALSTMWFFYELSQHPEVEAKIREELATKLKPLGVGPDGYVTADHAKQLVYLEAAIKETLRLHSAAPLLQRTAAEDTIIDGDLLIRKGESVGLSVYALARNPSVWGPDAAEFKPERWIDPKTAELMVFPSTKFYSFSAGPRQCIGMNLAMLNLRILTANMLHRYKFTIDPLNDGSYVNALVLAMKHPLMAKVERV